MRLLSLAFVVSILLSGCTGPDKDTQTNLSPAETGERIFSVRCSRCHSTVPETVIVGPSLAGIASRAGDYAAGQTARDYLEQSIRQPQVYLVEGFKNLMPDNFQEVLRPDQINFLIEYLLTLN